MAQSNDNVNLSVVQHGVNHLKIEHTPFPGKPGPNEVTLETHTVGICGSDVHILIHGRGSGPTILNTPMICGHESSAVVVEVGDNVKDLKKGDRVAIEPAVPCFKCELCKEGSYNVCPEIVCQAAPPYDGCLRRFYNHNAAFCHKIPDNMSFGEGALIEPLAVAVYACKRAGIVADTQPKVLVTGAGPIGLLCALTAKALGAVDVCIIDINKSRLEFAKQLGIEKTLLVSKLEDEQTIAAEIVGLLGSRPNITIECTGVEICVNIAIDATRDGGSIVLVGFNPKKINVALTRASDREITLVGTKRYRNSFPTAISLVSSGKLDVKPLITHVFDMKRAVEAFDTAKSCADGVIKVHINCQQ